MSIGGLPPDFAACRTFFKPGGGEVTVRVTTPEYRAEEDWWFCGWSIVGFDEGTEVSVTVPGPDSMAALLSALAMCGEKLEACQQLAGYRLQFLGSNDNGMLRIAHLLAVGEAEAGMDQGVQALAHVNDGAATRDRIVDEKGST